MISLVKMLTEAVHALHVDHNISIRTNYTGRCMGNRTCVGITGADAACQTVLQTVIGEMFDTLYTTSIDVELEGDDEIAANTLSKCHEYLDTLFDNCQDSMGLDVIMYWPQLQATDDDVAFIENLTWED